MNETIKWMLYNAWKYVWWHVWNKWKDDNQKIIGQIKANLDIHNTMAVGIGTIEDWWWGSSERAYFSQELKQPAFNDRLYDQTEHKDIWWYVMCFWYGNLNNASMNLWVEFDSSTLREYTTDLTKTEWYKPQWGWYFSKWADVTDNYIKDMKFIRYYFSMNLYKLQNVLDSGHAISIPINVSQEILDWMYEDWILSDKEVTGNTKFSHLMNIRKSKDNKVVMWMDNYPNRDVWNVFVIESLEALYRSWKLKDIARFYSPVEDIPEKDWWQEIPETLNDDEDSLNHYQIAVWQGFISKDRPKALMPRDDVWRAMGRMWVKVNQKFKEK